jgi:hypothetical protein
MEKQSKKLSLKNDEIPINKVKIIKELGHGIMGTVYLVSYKGKQYALKIEHILEEDIEDKTSPTWNEIYFTEDVANKHPEQFMVLHNYDFIDKCELKQEYATDLSFFPEPKQKYLKKLAASPYCVRKIYSLVDTVLDKVKLNSVGERYSMIIQLLYIIYLMESKKYVHADFHPGNVGVVYTKNKYIDILGHKIPTYGKIYKAIDYGGVLNEDTMDPTRKIMGLDEIQENVYEWAKIGDKLPLMMINIDDSDFWKYVKKNKINLDRDKDREEVLNSNEIVFIKDIVRNDELRFELMRILFPAKFQKIVLGKYFEKVIPWKINIPMEDILMFFIHFENTMLLLEYFLTRAESPQKRSPSHMYIISDE